MSGAGAGTPQGFNLGTFSSRCIQHVLWADLCSGCWGCVRYSGHRPWSGCTRQCACSYADGANTQEAGCHPQGREHRNEKRPKDPALTSSAMNSKPRPALGLQCNTGHHSRGHVVPSSQERHTLAVICLLMPFQNPTQKGFVLLFWFACEFCFVGFFCLKMYLTGKGSKKNRVEPRKFMKYYSVCWGKLEMVYLQIIYVNKSNKPLGENIILFSFTPISQGPFLFIYVVP